MSLNFSKQSFRELEMPDSLINIWCYTDRPNKGNNEYFYCLNREQLGQYWKCVVEDRDSFCPSRCNQCNICKEMWDVFTELQDSYFFYPKSSVANNQE